MFNYPIGSNKPAPKKAAPKHHEAAPAEHEPMHEGSKPVMTHHNEDGTHTTIHDDGQEHQHENLEALKQHLDQFFTEEGHEPSEEHEEY